MENEIEWSPNEIEVLSPQGVDTMPLLEDDKIKVTSFQEETDQKNYDLSYHLLEDIKKQLENLQKLFFDHYTSDSAKSKTFDCLYEELKRYKEDFYFKLRKPLFLNLLLYHDNFNKLVEKHKKNTELLNDIEALQKEFMEILYRQEIAPMEFEKHLNPLKHKTVATVPAETPEEHKTISATAKTGFYYENQVLRPAEVIVKIFSSEAT